MPSLRPEKDGMTNAKAGDPHGFPMSHRLCNCPTLAGKGVRFNISGRMMAVQAPGNWGTVNDLDFFRRHFYRSLLQRIFLDRGVTDPPIPIWQEQENEKARANGEKPKPSQIMSSQPIIIGSLRKKCYVDFVSYVRGAIHKLLNWDSKWSHVIESQMSDIEDEEIQRYEAAYSSRHKHLNLLWSFMAFSAQLLEAVVVVDRWLWLKEQDEVLKCWVEPVFDYKLSPRNLVVVAIKK